MEYLPAWAPDWLKNQAWLWDTVDYFRSIWHEGVFGITYGQMFIVIGVMLVAFIVRGLFARTVVMAITRAAAGTKTNLDDALVKTISEPLKLVPLIIGAYIAFQLMELGPDAQIAADKVLQSLVAISIFWSLNRAVAAFSFVLGSFEKTLGWMVKTLQAIFIAMGVAAVLQIWDVPVLPVIGGLGVFGVAIAFGAQDLVKNLISGLFLLIEKRFIPGEWIRVDGVVEGTVEQIGFRSTTVRQFDKSPVYVPNAVFSDREVVNFSRMTHRRIKWAIGVEYRTTIEQLKYIRDEIEAYIYTNDDFAKPPAAGLLVYIDNFNDSSIDFLIYCFTTTTNWGEWLEIKQALAIKVMEIVKAAGTDFAFPSRTLYMQQQDPPEVFSPPELSPTVAEARRIKGLSGGALPKAGRMGGDDG
ncbi:MAG: mechanosensitive ion channel family protein [Hyphomonadaceae bacterium]